MKIGVIAVRRGQTEPKDMFRNGTGGDDVPDKFWSWMNDMGKKVDLSTLTGYRGDMGMKGESYNENWKGIDIMYHVSPMLDSEGHRRLVGNDIAVIFFLEEGDDIQFDPSGLPGLGTVPQIFAVVQPKGDEYRLAFFSNINIKPFEPYLPTRETLKPAEAKDLLLTKLFNGLVTTSYCPPLNRLFYLPRSKTLEELMERFPPEKKEAAKARLKEEWKAIADSRQASVADCLLIRVIAAKQVGGTDKSAAREPYASVSLLDQKEKTRAARALNPIWNTDVTFSLHGVESLHDSLEVTLHDASSRDFLGQLVVPVGVILEMIFQSRDKTAQPKWFPLMRSNTTDIVTGSILLGFALKPPGSRLASA